MSTTIKQLIVVSVQSLMTTELNSLADGSSATATTAFDNTVGSTGDGSLYWEVELNIATLAGTPNDGFGVSVWFISEIDATNLETLATSSTTRPPLGRAANVTFNFNALTTPGRMTRVVPAPAGLTKAVAWVNGTGRALASSANTLKIRPLTYQQV